MSMTGLCRPLFCQLRVCADLCYVNNCFVQTFFVPMTFVKTFVMSIVFPLFPVGSTQKRIFLSPRLASKALGQRCHSAIRPSQDALSISGSCVPEKKIKNRSLVPSDVYSTSSLLWTSVTAINP